MTGIYLVTCIACVIYFSKYRQEPVAALLTAIVGTAVFIIVVALTGTKPGGPMRF